MRKQKVLDNVLYFLEVLNKIVMSSIKGKTNVLTIETKLEIINQLEKCMSGSSLAVHYYIGKTMHHNI